MISMYTLNVIAQEVDFNYLLQYVENLWLVKILSNQS